MHRFHHREVAALLRPDVGPGLSWRGDWPPRRHCRAAHFSWRLPQGEGAEGKGAGGWLCAVGLPQRARRETTSANGCPSTCRGCERVKTVCRVSPGNLYSAHPRRGAGGGREWLEEGVFSIHAPTWEAALKAGRAILCGDISIRAPCGGWARRLDILMASPFHSTRPRGV